MTDTKKRILQLAKNYKLLSMLEGHAGDRDDMVAAEQYRVSGKKAWDELGVELDKLFADNDRLRGELTMARAAYESERAKKG